MDSAAAPPSREDDPIFLFIHVMKTGGTSMLRHLVDNFEIGQMEPDPRLNKKRGGRWLRPEYGSVNRLRDLPTERKAEVRLYAGHVPYMVTELLKPDATFTMLREPVERTISLLRHYKHREPDKVDCSLEEIYDDRLQFELLMHNYQAKLFSLTPADDPPDRAHLCAIDVDAQRLAAAKENLNTLDVVGIHNRYREFLEDLTSRFGWRFPNDHRRRVATDRSAVPKSLERRIATDNEADLDFYHHAVAMQARRRR